MLMTVLEFSVKNVRSIMDNSFKMKENILRFISTGAMQRKYDLILLLRLN